jgi:integrase
MDIGVSPRAGRARLGAKTAAQAARATTSRFIRGTSLASKQTIGPLAKTQKISLASASHSLNAEAYLRNAILNARPRCCDAWLAKPGEYFDQGFVFSDKYACPFKLDAPTKAFREIAGEAELLPKFRCTRCAIRSHHGRSRAAGDIVAVQRCLGHSVPSTTLNLYSHVVAGGREKAVAAVSDTLRRAQAARAAGGK